MSTTGRMRDVYEQVSSYQAFRFAQLGATYGGVQRSWRPDVYWFWGPTGTGKTRTAHKMAPDAYFTPSTLQWWDGYDGHEDVIVDDFRASFCKLEYLLRLTDRYPFRVAFKGGFRQFLAKRIFFTSAFSPEALFDGGRDNVDQLLRRIKVIREFTADDKRAMEAEDAESSGVAGDASAGERGLDASAVSVPAGVAVGSSPDSTGFLEYAP